jgi:hypothetical protein
MSRKTRKKVTTRIVSICTVYDFCLVVGATAPLLITVVRPLVIDSTYNVLEVLGVAHLDGRQIKDLSLPLLYLHAGGLFQLLLHPPKHF